MKRQQKKKKVWQSPKKIQAFIRFNTLPGSYFKNRAKRNAKKKKSFY